MSNGGTSPSTPTQTVRWWETPVTLSNSIKQWNVFMWWYTTEDFQEWTKVTTNAISSDSDVMLYAKRWHTIIFKSNWWTSVGSIIVAEWEILTQPANPEFPWYNFLWWYTDEGLTQEYDFNRPVTENITLYAKWEYKYEFDDIDLYLVSNEWDT